MSGVCACAKTCAEWAQSHGTGAGVACHGDQPAYPLDECIPVIRRVPAPSEPGGRGYNAGRRLCLPTTPLVAGSCEIGGVLTGPGTGEREHVTLESWPNLKAIRDGVWPGAYQI